MTAMIEELEAMIENEIDRVVAARVVYVKHVADCEIELLAALRRVRDVEHRLDMHEGSVRSSDARLKMLNKALAVAKEHPGLVRREDCGYSVAVDHEAVFIIDPEKL